MTRQFFLTLRLFSLSKGARAVAIGATACHALVAGSYRSTELR